MNRPEIKKSYEDMLPHIKKIYPRTDPYFYPFFENLTPIERNVWSEIRAFGLPMYMQFPVLDFFLDFADPVKKIGIEADGKKFHENTQIEDAIRQKKLEDEGWKIYRITGVDTFTNSQVPSRELSDEDSDPLQDLLKTIKLENYNVADCG